MAHAVLSSRRLAAAIALVSTIAVTSITAAHAGPNDRPFRASFTTQEQLRFDPTACPAPPYIVGATSGSGTATHLGATTGLATDCITPTSPTTFSFTNGNLVLTASNGDEVFITYGGALLPTATPPVFAINGGFYRITGGTGRFASATGSGALTGITNIVTGQGQLNLTGTINY